MPERLNMWTPTALASEARLMAGTVWRVVEHQYTASTRKIVDTLAEQDLLEEILEESKPPYPPEAERLHYLLKTPFRYYPANPYGSRFRRCNIGEGVFYASEHIRTALAEFSYYRIRFFQASPDTPLPRNEERLTAFTAAYQSHKALDLTLAPLNRDRHQWIAANDYSATQSLADNVRKAEIDAIRYESVRDAEQGINIALLQPSVFVSQKPIIEQTWFLYLAPTEVNCVRVNTGGSDEKWTFPRSQFAL